MAHILAAAAADTTPAPLISRTSHIGINSRRRSTTAAITQRSRACGLGLAVQLPDGAPEGAALGIGDAVGP